MTDDSTHDRRAVLKAGATTLAAGALSGCVADGRGESPDETTRAGSNETAPGTATAPEEDDVVTVAVGHGGESVFEPGTDRPLTVPAGTEVRFVWASDNHNIVAEDQPEDADWEGTPGGPGEVYDAGYEHSHVFGVPGTYEFYCTPHRSVGMVGTIVVDGE